MTQEEKEKKEAWEKLKAKMAKANLSLAEQELIKKEILHREAIINREGLGLFCVLQPDINRPR